MEFSGLYSLVYTAFNYYIFPASIDELAGEPKSKIKPDKVYYYASIHDLQTVLRCHLQRSTDLHDQILCHLLMLQH